jgi:hypothetical protein
VAGSRAPVIAGLAIGIAFVVLFSSLFAQESNTFPIGVYNPEPGRYADKAVKIALENDTVQQLFKDKEIAVVNVRDYGVTMGSDCPINQCAAVVFGDKAGNMRTEKLYAITVNVLSGRVVDIAPSKDILIERTNNIEEVKYFLSEYPDAEVIVNRYPNDHAEVIHRVERAIILPEEIRNWPETHSLSLWVEMAASTGKIKDVYVECGAAMTDRATANIIEYIQTTDCLNPDWDNVDYGQHG